MKRMRILGLRYSSEAISLDRLTKRDDRSEGWGHARVQFAHEAVYVF